MEKSQNSYYDYAIKFGGAIEKVVVIGGIIYQSVNNIANGIKYFSKNDSERDPELVKSIEETIFDHSTNVTWDDIIGISNEKKIL